MRRINVTIERSSDFFSSYATNIAGIYGGGESVQEAKNSIVEAIELFKKHNPKRIPDELSSEYELVFHFDAQSFFDYYKGIFTNAALERLTGINQRLIYQYATGLKRPGKVQLQKFQTALHNLAEELKVVELV